MPISKITNASLTDGVNVSFNAGSAAAPSISAAGDTNTGIFFPAADTIAFAEGGAEVARFDSSGNFAVGTTTPTTFGGFKTFEYVNSSGNAIQLVTGTGVIAQTISSNSNSLVYMGARSNHGLVFTTNDTERARITSDGVFAVGKTSTDSSTVGASMRTDGYCTMVRSADKCLDVNRKTNDGTLVAFQQDNTEEGSISVSGTTVSYNGGHLSRWAQMLTKPDLLKGTVMSNLDEMNEYVDADGNPVENEQLNKVKVSDVEGDANVAGVFVNWDYDEVHQVDEINMAMTGDMIIRIAQGVTVARGDLLMSAGDGTAKPQGDDIVRSKTIAKVTSTHVTCTYDDGSYCVPCVLMAC